MTLVARAAVALDALVPTRATCLVAVSGGPDSLALLDLLHRSQEVHGRRLIVGHVDHGISDQSADVADGVAQAATLRGLVMRRVRLELGAGASETKARTARQSALRGMAAECGAGVIVLGHHADDQAETVLLRLLRGSGPAGLAGMAARTGVWVRPLLMVTRRELAEYLVARNLTAWHDPANADPRHLRSWLRGAVIPIIAARLSDAVPRLLQSARQAAAARVAWDEIPALLEPLDLRTEPDAISVAAPPLSGYRSEVRHAVLAALGRRFGVPFGQRRLLAIERLLRSGSGRVRLAGRLEAELYHARLTLRFLGVGVVSDLAIPLRPGCVVRVGRAELIASDASGAIEASRAGWNTELAPGSYLVRAWRRGDRIRPLNGCGSRAVSVLLREARVPVGRRPEWPVVTEAATATIVWVPGICRADVALPEPGARVLHVECAVT